MKFPSAISQKVVRQVLLGKKHSPTIMFAAGIVGVVGSTVLACRATMNLEETLDDARKDMELAKSFLIDDEPNKKEIAGTYVRNAGSVVKLYAPSVALGVVSIGLLTGSHITLNKRNASLVAAYAALESGFNEYRQRVIDDLGVDKDRKYRHNLEVCEIEDSVTGKKKKVERIGNNSASIYARLFDVHSDSWSPTPEYNVLFLRAQQNYCNDKLKAKGHLFLNEVYDMLGLERSKAGAVVGWLWDTKNGDNYIDFGIFDNRASERFYDFVVGNEDAVLLDFNVDGVIYDKI